MAEMTKQEVLIAYNNAFPGGKNLNGVPIPKDAFLNFWEGRESTELRGKLREDTQAGGVYADYRNQQSPGGPGDPTDTTPTDDSSETKGISWEDYLKGPGKALADTWTPEALAEKFGPKYERKFGEEEYGKGLAIEDKDELLRRLEKQKGLATADYEKQLGRFGQEKEQAFEDFQRNLERTTEYTGDLFNQGNLYGSGIYQKELGRQTGDISRGYNRAYGADDSAYAQRLGDYKETYQRAYGTDGSGQDDSAHGRQVSDINQSFRRNYGEGQYTPYNMRKFDLEQQRESDYGAYTLGQQDKAGIDWKEYNKVLTGTYQ